MCNRVIYASLIATGAASVGYGGKVIIHGKDEKPRRKQASSYRRKVKGAARPRQLLG